MNTLYTILQQTPWWVYLIFAYIILIGIKASQTAVVTLRRLFILPIIFVIFSVHTLIVEVPLNKLMVVTWLIAIMVGIGLGYWQIHRLRIEVDKQHHLIRIPGSWTTLFLVIIIFAAKYYFGYMAATHPDYLRHPRFDVIILLVSGVLTGMFIGRLVCYLHNFKTGVHVDLTAGKQ